MLPIPAATTTLTNTLVTSQPVYNAFKGYGFMEIGIMLGALVIIFIVYAFRNALFGFLDYLRAGFAHRQSRKFDFSSQHRDSAASSAAISEHKRFKKILGGGNRISRYD